MGVCVSKPKVEDDIAIQKSNNHKRRRRILRRHICPRKVEVNSIHSAVLASNRASDAAWFDSISDLDSECDDEFYSVYDGVGEVFASHADEVGEDKKLAPDSCGGILPNACLPCISSSALPVEKRRHSAEYREEVTKHALSLSGVLNQKLLPGLMVPFCPIEKQIPGSWSSIEPSSFRVRGKNYFRDKKKEFAPNNAAFYPLGADLFLSPRKVDHIARFIQIPTTNVPGDIPSVLIVNIQIPLYPATFFQNENDGDGMNVVLYFKLSERYAKDLPYQFRENIAKIINDEVETIKGFPLDTITPFRDRLKILGRLANAENLVLGAAEKKLFNAYNEKPVLSRPQHEFYLGENYLEIDIDVHRFSYIARKGFSGFIDRLPLCNLDFALTMQGNKPEDLPEHIICAIRLNKLDYNNFNQIVL
ncbi:unnamed protein product [Lupinus luteus]|uniref:Protein ENHANCED DISEASE RESISTANCE 2 C-terminal domain-containing protein n=1 Tax=Lupinus luteus TaxID=3873 RepID=A0AAV1XKR6_LUPLU